MQYVEPQPILARGEDIRILVFRNRIEIISPGHMPGDLNPQDIQQGKTKRRNPVLSEHAAHLLPFRGLGSGIHRALQAWPQIELQDYQSGNEFKAVIARPKPPAQVISPSGIGSYSATDPVTPPVTPPVKKVLELLNQQDGLSNAELRERLNINDRRHVRRNYIDPALETGLVEMTIPNKPNSRLQRYQLTFAGKNLMRQQERS